MKKIILTALIATIFLAACNRDRYKQQDDAMLTNRTQELKVPSDFDWKTTVTHEITFTSPFSGLIEVTNADGKSYQQAYLRANKTFEMKLTMPSWEKQVKVNFRGKTWDLTLTGQQTHLRLD